MKARAPARTGNGGTDGDPVNLSTGQFVMDKTDLVVRDVIPMTLTRTYRTGDNGSRPFGIGGEPSVRDVLWSAHQYSYVKCRRRARLEHRSL
jgi:hypothetical protein